MKITTFFLFAFLAFGQEKLSEEARAQAWATIEAAAPKSARAAEMSPIPRAALVREQQVNGYGEKVVLTFTQPGLYLFSGVTCEGSPVRLGDTGYYDTIGGMGALHLLVVDTTKLMEAAPSSPRLCWVNVFRLTRGGEVQQLETYLAAKPSNQPTQVVAESVDFGNGYFVHLSSPKIQKGATVAIGRGAVSGIVESVGNNIFRVGFPIGTFFLPEPGPTTLTICQGGKCETEIVSRRLEINSGKG